MVIVRFIEHGERIADLLDELRALTFETDNEHALVRLTTGERALVEGEPDGINFGWQITRLYVHTHPYYRPTSGPSDDDFAALVDLRQTHSYLLERGLLTKFRRH